MQINKKSLIAQVSNELDQKFRDLQKSIEQAIESRDSDSKSSMGDKYETSRAMVQMEIEKAKVELSKVVQQKNELSKIDYEKKYQEIRFGSIVITNEMSFLIAFAFGKIIHQNQPIYVISLASPLGRSMEGRMEGSQFSFQSNKITIEKVY